MSYLGLRLRTLSKVFRYATKFPQRSAHNCNVVIEAMTASVSFQNHNSIFSRRHKVLKAFKDVGALHGQGFGVMRMYV